MGKSKKSTASQYVKAFLVFYVVTNVLASFIMLAIGDAAFEWYSFLLYFSISVTVLYLIFKRFLTVETIYVNVAVFVLLCLTFTVMMVISKGALEGTFMANMSFPLFPFIFSIYIIQLSGGSFIYPAAIALVGYELLLSIVLQKRKDLFKKFAACMLVLVLSAGISYYFYSNRDAVKYAGHGFNYMHGFSSTDFTDYTVYSENSKLAELPGEASFTIKDEADMPVMDGAEACYPVYAAVAKAVYKDIDRIEKAVSENAESRYRSTNGKIVSFTNTVVGLERLYLDKEVDLFFGARPSTKQKEEAEVNGVTLQVTPIGKEAFVFFVEADNPIDNLTSDQVKGIYNGTITDWSELGGDKGAIKAFQRPQGSGSQTMMEYFMGGAENMKEPDTYEVIAGMEGVISKVAQYSNEDGAIGYTFRYFLLGLNQEKNVKLLSIDGVEPTLENINSGAYPLTTSLCLITREGDENENVQKMIDFMLSDQGQYIVEKTGYAPLAVKNP